MELLKSIINEEILAEMSNIEPEEHHSGVNIIFHILQPGKWMHSGHGPRIKLFKGNFQNSSNVVIILDKDKNNIKVLDKSYTDKKLIKLSQLNQLVEYFKKYRFAYLIMWLDQGMSNRKLMTLLDEIDKNPKEVENKFYKLYRN